MRPAHKLAALKKLISGYGSCLVAFSGGADSTFLLKVASLALPKANILAVTADSPTYPPEELAAARKIAARLGVRHLVIKTKEFEDQNFLSNPVNRCYFCKKELFAALKVIARKKGLRVVCDASNYSDRLDLRPGQIAKKELEVYSPLAQAQITKEEIRAFSRNMRLPTWSKPSLACLASRIPYGTKITTGALKRVNLAEKYIRRMGFTQVRVRHYDGLCRIEVPKDDIPQLLTRRKQIVDNLKKLGYNFITVDLEGYRTGSMNPGTVLKPKQKCP
jgi:uncharacterized protein